MAASTKKAKNMAKVKTESKKIQKAEKKGAKAGAKIGKSVLCFSLRQCTICELGVIGRSKERAQSRP